MAIDVTIGGHRERVRLIGINTPETVDPRRPVECFGHEASEHTKTLLPAGTEVDLVRDVEPRDAYGRLLERRNPTDASTNLGGDAALWNTLSDITEKILIPLRFSPLGGGASTSAYTA